jgi:hypothetical protein
LEQLEKFMEEEPMANDRLRNAMAAQHVSVQDIADATRVDPKTVQRWMGGRVPHARYRALVSKLLREREDYLWPPNEHSTGNSSSEQIAEILAAYGQRAQVPPQAWWQLFAGAREQIDLLGYALHFLPEQLPDLPTLLLEKASQECRVRIALGDPDSARILERDQEEQLGGTLPARIRATLYRFSALTEVPGIDIRLHSAPLYNSVFRSDDEMFVTPHLYSVHGSRAPLLHLRRLGQQGIFAGFAGHFEAIWATTTPAHLVAATISHVST